MREEFVTFKEFKGLAQHVENEELDPRFCHTLINLNVDDPVGRLSLRDGWALKYNDTLTDILSAYEYRFEDSGQTVLIFNDNGTLRYLLNGTIQSNPSLPSGATLEAAFRNQYLGYRNGIIITTGNGATNYVLGFYYTKRLAASNDGLFGNAVEDTGNYRLLKSQLNFEEGMFARIYNIVQIGTYYYISFQSSKWVEKRDSNWQLVDKFIANTDAAANTTVALAADSTYLYIGTEDGVYKVNPNGLSIVQSSTAITGVRGLAVDADYLFAISETEISRFNIADFTTEVDETHVDNFYDITCEPSSGGAIYTLDSSGNLSRYVKNDFADGNHTHVAVVGGTPKHIIFDNTNNYVVVPGGAFVKRYTDSTLALVDTNTFTDCNLQAIMPDFKCIDDDFGAVYPFNSTTPSYPNLFTLAIYSLENGDIEAGTLFYKIAVEDTLGNISIPSDPAFVTIEASTDKVNLRISCNDTLNVQLYRIKYVHIFRAYSSTADAETPTTNYKLLKTIDINDQAWVNNANQNIWYYAYADNTTETTISTVTYEEMSGVNESVKPRYTNYKYITQLGDYFHVANFRYDGVNYKNRVVISAFGTPDVVPLSTDYYDFGLGDGDVIKGISNIYGRTIVFKDRRAGYFYEKELEKEFPDGLAYDSSFFRREDDLFYIGKKGLYWVKGAEAVRISDPVKTYFAAISTWTHANVFYLEDKDRVIFAVPGTRSFIYNTKYDVWTTYDATGFPWRGLFKNFDNEYIAWSGTRFGKVFAGATTDNSAAITIGYESPILKFSDRDGEAVCLTREDYRVNLTTATSFALYLYKYYTASNKTAIDTHTMVDPTSTSIAHKSHFLTSCWGEAFSWLLSGSGTVFILSSLTIGFNKGGAITE